MTMDQAKNLTVDQINNITSEATIRLMTDEVWHFLYPKITNTETKTVWDSLPEPTSATISGGRYRRKSRGYKRRQSRRRQSRRQQSRRR